MNVTIRADGNFEAKRLKVATTGNTGNAFLDIDVGGDIDLTSANVAVTGKDKKTYVHIEAGGDLVAKKSNLGVHTIKAKAEQLTLAASSGDITLQGARLKADQIDLETCNSAGGCSEDPHLDLRKVKFTYSTDSFCIDGEDIEDVEDVTIQTAGKKPLNGC